MSILILVIHYIIQMFIHVLFVLETTLFLLETKLNF